MYRTKSDFYKHNDLMKEFLLQRETFYSKESTVVNLSNLSEKTKNAYFLLQDQLQKLSVLVENDVISVEKYLHDAAVLTQSAQKDINDLRNSSIKNDTTLTNIQKINLLKEPISYHTGEGALSSSELVKYNSGLLTNIMNAYNKTIKKDPPKDGK